MASREKAALLEDDGSSRSYHTNGTSRAGRTPAASRTSTLNPEHTQARMSNMIQLLESARRPKADTPDGGPEAERSDSPRIPTLPFVGGTAAYVEELRQANVPVRSAFVLCYGIKRIKKS